MVKRSVIVLGIFVILFFAFNLYSYSSGHSPYHSISGRFIDKFPEISAGINLSIVLFVGQWVVLLLIVFLAYMNFLKHKKAEVKIDTSLIQRPKGKSETDLDILLQLLNQQKTLSLAAIAKSFNIPKETALEWAKILENNELAQVEYPAFSDPEIRLKEEKPKTSVEKETKKPESIKQKIKKEKPKQIISKKANQNEKKK